MTPTDLNQGIDLALTSLLAKRLVILAGAGLSMAAPSKLPSAWTLAQKAKSKYTSQWGTSKPPLSDQIDEQAEFFFSNSELQTVYLSTLIDRHAFAGPPNKGHLAIADLMLTRAAQTVVTTNVDVLIESAGNELFGQIETGIDGVSVAGLPADVIPMLKIHGCRIIDWPNTVWAAGQLTVNPVRDRIASSAPWLQQRLLNRDILIVGYWTDWDYLNEVLDVALNAVTPSRVIVVDTAPTPAFPTKAPALYALGGRAAAGFHHVQESGTEFLELLRRRFSQQFVRTILQSGVAEFEHAKGAPPNADWLETTVTDNQQLWLMRRDLLGCAPNAPAETATPPDEPLLGMLLLQLQDAGATPEGPYWQLNGKLIRVLRTPNQMLHRVEALYDGDVAPINASDFVVAVGATTSSLAPSVARGAGTTSIARTSGGQWLTYADAVSELGL